MSFDMAIDFSSCRDEQQFKKKWITKEKLNSFDSGAEYFCIESEETEPEFPDVMKLVRKEEARFFEFKFSNKSGTIKFQPTQPAFYKHHPSMHIHVVAFDSVNNVLHNFDTSELFHIDSPYYLGTGNTVNLASIWNEYIKAVQEKTK